MFSKLSSKTQKKQKWTHKTWQKNKEIKRLKEHLYKQEEKYIMKHISTANRGFSEKSEKN